MKNCRNPLQFEAADENEKLCHLFPKVSALENRWLNQMLKKQWHRFSVLKGVNPPVHCGVFSMYHAHVWTKIKID